MRYSTPIYFQRITPGEYDPANGDYGDDTLEETMRYASVTDTRTETKRLVYGEIREGSMTVQLLNPYTEPFDRIRIGEKIYSVDHTTRPKTSRRQLFVVSEVQ